MNKKDYKNLWYLGKAVYRQEKKLTILMLILAVLRAVNDYILFVLMGYIIDAANNHTDLQEMLKVILVTLTAKLIIEVITRWITEQCNKKHEQIPQEIASRDLNVQALTFDYEHLENPEVQDLRFRSFQRSWYGIGGWFLQVGHSAIKNTISMIMSLVIMLPMFKCNRAHMGYTFGMVVILAVLIVINYIIGVNGTRNALQSYFQDSNLYNKKLFYLDLFSKMEPQKDIRVMKMEQAVMNDVKTLFKKVQTSEQKQGEFYIKRQILQKLILNLATLFIYVYTAVCAVKNLISIGQVVTFAASMAQMMYCANVLAVNFGHLKSAAMYAEDYKDFMTLPDKKYKGTIPVEKRRDAKFQVAFEHVSFKYPGAEDYVIKDLNLSLVIGEKLAIVGKNGSGKTTFVKLLCRLYDVTEGTIKVNGIDIRKYDYQDYCALFSVVFQDFALFDLPVGENVAGNANYEQEEVKKAMNKVGLDDIACKLTDGLDTYIGKECNSEGVNFSGGERQRLAIARAIYKDAPFVIMDEPTAALDPEAEAEVFESFDEMVGKKTAIYISHRLASCKFCEDILVFDKGKVVQHGSHEMLSREDGLYKSLWNAQAQYYA